MSDLSLSVTRSTSAAAATAGGVSARSVPNRVVSIPGVQRPDGDGVVGELLRQCDRQHVLRGLGDAVGVARPPLGLVVVVGHLAAK